MSETETMTRSRHNGLLRDRSDSISAVLEPSSDLSQSELSKQLRLAYAPIATELGEAERIFQEELGSRSEFVQRLVEHSSRFRGKQLRPALLLLTAKACGGIQPAHPVLAAVVEMIHTATLIHDDILDEAEVRRHASTINAEWGNEAAVLLGDYLFTHAFHLASSLETAYACRLIGRATNLVCEGELQQIHHRGNLQLDEQSYYEIVRGKTAELTAVSCRLGAHYAGADAATSDALDRFGRDLGVAFQIADDVLDLCGDEEATGKTLGTDLEKQKLTLPVIRLLESVSPTEAAEIKELLEHTSLENSERLRSFIRSSDAVEEAWRSARGFVASARQELERLPDSEAKTILTKLATMVIRRSY